MLLVINRVVIVCATYFRCILYVFLQNDITFQDAAPVFILCLFFYSCRKIHNKTGLNRILWLLHLCWCYYLNIDVWFYRRRMQQLKLWQQREKEWARTRAKREKSNKRSIYFSDSVMLLEAAARNDIEEGEYVWLAIPIN